MSSTNTVEKVTGRVRRKNIVFFIVYLFLLILFVFLNDFENFQITVFDIIEVITVASAKITSQGQISFRPNDMSCHGVNYHFFTCILWIGLILSQFVLFIFYRLTDEINYKYQSFDGSFYILAQNLFYTPRRYSLRISVQFYYSSFS